MTFASRQCVACRGGEPLLNDAEIQELHANVPEWEVLSIDKILRLRRSFKFRNFSEAINFTNRIAVISEEQGHHPLITTEWGRVTVLWWTHKILGLHTNDFIMAAKTDQIFR
jgi:4a-hydroxytetrahydrobiopterin dehydratase